MSTHEISIRITPVCTCCGEELREGGLIARPTGVIFERDDPSERVEQRLFVDACPKCFAFLPDVDADQLRAEKKLAEMREQCNRLLTLCNEWVIAWDSQEFEPDLAKRMRAAIASCGGNV